MGGRTYGLLLAILLLLPLVQAPIGSQCNDGSANPDPSQCSSSEKCSYYSCWTPFSRTENVYPDEGSAYNPSWWFDGSDFSTCTGGGVYCYAPSCSDVCTQDAERCYGDQLQECVTGGSGCTVWTMKEDCTAGSNNACDATPTPHCVECTWSGDCGGSTPNCDVSSNQCVECTWDGDCSGSTPTCDTSIFQCVECLNDGDCSGSKPECRESTNICVECTDNSHCAGGSTCNFGTYTCECSNECSPGQVQCTSSNQYESCGNFDADSCYEWGNPQTCSGSEPYCYTGLNVPTTQPPCGMCSQNSHCSGLATDSYCSGSTLNEYGSTCTSGICEVTTRTCSDDCYDDPFDSYGAECGLETYTVGKISGGPGVSGCVAAGGTYYVAAPGDVVRTCGQVTYSPGFASMAMSLGSVSGSTALGYISVSDPFECYPNAGQASTGTNVCTGACPDGDKLCEVLYDTSKPYTQQGTGSYELVYRGGGTPGDSYDFAIATTSNIGGKQSDFTVIIGSQPCPTAGTSNGTHDFAGCSASPEPNAHTATQYACGSDTCYACDNGWDSSTGACFINPQCDALITDSTVFPSPDTGSPMSYPVDIGYYVDDCSVATLCSAGIPLTTYNAAGTTISGTENDIDTIDCGQTKTYAIYEGSTCSGTPESSFSVTRTCTGLCSGSITASPSSFNDDGSVSLETSNVDATYASCGGSEIRICVDSGSGYTTAAEDTSGSGSPLSHTANYIACNTTAGPRVYDYKLVQGTTCAGTTLATTSVSRECHSTCSAETCNGLDDDCDGTIDNGNLCGAGLICQGGACVADCTNECAPGTQRCVGTGTETCGDYDADSCTEWGGSITSCGTTQCATDSCTGATLVDYPVAGSATRLPVSNTCSGGTCDPANPTGGACTPYTETCSVSKECKPANYNCAGGPWETCHRTNTGSWQWGTSLPSETACTDFYDNDCNGESDYDTRDGRHGDINCPVGVTAISVSNANPNVGAAIDVSCTVTATNVNSVFAYIDEDSDGQFDSGDSKCPWGGGSGWSGNTATFANCPVGVAGLKNAACGIYDDPAEGADRSYQSGADRTTAINVNDSSGCSAHATLMDCNDDVNCEWIPECRATSPRYSGYPGGECLPTGSIVTYSCNLACGDTCETATGCADNTRCQNNRDQVQSGICDDVSCTCSYGSWANTTCADSVANCGAACAADSDCNPQLNGNNCEYNPTCQGNCTCNYANSDYCPVPGTTSGTTCYYGSRTCTGSGCGLNTCTLAGGETCNPTFGCVPSSCGDGTIQPGETCDGTEWGPVTDCTDFDTFTGGVLTCDSDCHFDTSACTGTPGPVCGDGSIQEGETCDGSNWGPITSCSDFDSFTGGSLSCGSDCKFNTSACVAPAATCGNGIIEPGETCDGSDWGPITSCSDFDAFTGGSLSCNPATCQFDTTACVGTPGPVCGDGGIQEGETCDGSNWGPIMGCSNFDTFTGGNLTCDSSCHFNTSECVTGPWCGNDAVEGIETCDGTDLAGEDCTTLGYDVGTLKCYPNTHANACEYDVSGCAYCDPVPDSVCVPVCGGFDPDCNAELDGYVRDSQGNPLAAATVSVVAPPSGYTDSTNGAGYYAISGLPTGNYQVSALKPGYTSVTLDHTFTGTEQLNFTLENGSCALCADWEGRCSLECSGAPLCGATVPAVCDGARPDEWLSYNSTHYVLCCGGGIFKPKVSSAVETQGCMRNLVATDRLVRYHGRFVTMRTFTWSPCQ